MIKNKHSENNPFFDQFIIVGAPYTDYTDIVPNPEILNVFPCFPLVIEEKGMYQLVRFCFPDGIHPLNNKEKGGDTVLDYFAFRLGGSSVKYYGACVKIQIYNMKKLPFFATKSSAKFPFVFCIISATPFLSSHFQFLTYIAKSLVNIKKIRFKDQDIKPLHFMTGPTLSILDVKNGIGTCPKINPSKTFFYLVNLYRSIKQDMYDTKIYDFSSKLKLAIPRISNNSIYLAQCALDTLFSLLSISDIISIYAAALVGNYVIFRSKNVHHLTFSVLGLISLISPFPMHLPIMPIIPNVQEYLELLNSPIPFVFGISSDIKLSKYEIDPNATIVNLDENCIENQEFIEVPNKSEHIKNIEDILEREKANILIPQKTIKKNLFTQPEFNPEYPAFFERVCPLAVPRLSTQMFSTKYVFNERTVEDIIRVFSQQIGYWIELVKEEIKELKRM